jgi:hypothetical protein
MEHLKKEALREQIGTPFTRVPRPSPSPKHPQGVGRKIDDPDYLWVEYRQGVGTGRVKVFAPRGRRFNASLSPNVDPALLDAARVFLGRERDRESKRKVRETKLVSG